MAHPARWRSNRRYRMLGTAIVAVLLIVLVISVGILIDFGFLPGNSWLVVLRPLRQFVPLAFLGLVAVSYFKLYRLQHRNVAGSTTRESTQDVVMGVRASIHLVTVSLMLMGSAALIFVESRQMQVEHRTDQQREVILQTFVDDVSKLLLEQGLRTSPRTAEIRGIVSAQTIALLPRLNEEGKGTVLRFLHESELISTSNRIIRLENADFSGVDARLAGLRRINLRQANLHQANLRRADLRRADLSQANLTNTFLNYSNLANVNLYQTNLMQADLRHANMKDAYLKLANLRQADLTGADLTGVNLEQADLTGAVVAPEQLALCKSLVGTIMPDGSRHQ